jgi:hypothetical protein
MTDTQGSSALPPEEAPTAAARLRIELQVDTRSQIRAVPDVDMTEQPAALPQPPPREPLPQPTAAAWIHIELRPWPSERPGS